MTYRLRGRLAAAAGACALALVVAPAAEAAPPNPFGHACSPKAGVLFCPSATLDQRVPAFDGTPIDVDVTLPATGDGPFPTIVLLHGYGGNKTDAQEDAPNTGFNDVGLASRGYAVVTLSNRGFGMSCGQAASRTPDCSAGGWIHLADQRYEVRDTQELLGKLVDQGIADPKKLGAAGGSYGGGQSLQLAYLKDRIVLPDGTQQPWRSPNGTPLAIAAAAPQVPWADLAAALVPNGHWLDSDRYKASTEVTPVGVPIKSYINGLYAAGNAAGWVSPIGTDPEADLTGWRQRFVDEGEPYGSDAKAIGRQMQRFHSALGITGTPAPLIVANGWTDDLFPAPHALRAYNETRARNDDADISLILGAFGHGRGGKEPAIQTEANKQRLAFFDHWLKGEGSAPKAGQVTAGLVSCPDGKKSKLYKADSWEKMTPGGVDISAMQTQTVTSKSGAPKLGEAFDPIGAGPCDEVKAQKPKGSAFVEIDVDKTFVTIGRTDISARVAATGADSQLAVRVWDVDPKAKTMRLADRGIYRLKPKQKGGVEFQLNGNGWQWKKGHIVRVEVAGSDAPYYRPSDKKFTVKVSRLKASLPVR
jgi:predicted acyl esterase